MKHGLGRSGRSTFKASMIRTGRACSVPLQGGTTGWISACSGRPNRKDRTGRSGIVFLFLTIKKPRSYPGFFVFIVPFGLAQARMDAGLDFIQVEGRKWLFLVCRASQTFTEYAMDSDLIDIVEVCRALQTSPRNLRRLITKGQFPRPLRVGQRRLWPARIVREWIEKPYVEGASNG